MDRRKRRKRPIHLKEEVRDHRSQCASILDGALRAQRMELRGSSTESHGHILTESHGVKDFEEKNSNPEYNTKKEGDNKIVSLSTNARREKRN